MSKKKVLKDCVNGKGYKIYKVYREKGVSDKSVNRPKFQKMIQDMIEQDKQNTCL